MFFLFSPRSFPHCGHSMPHSLPIAPASLRNQGKQPPPPTNQQLSHPHTHTQTQHKCCSLTFLGAEPRDLSKGTHHLGLNLGILEKKTTPKIPEKNKDLEKEPTKTPPNNSQSGWLVFQTHPAPPEKKKNKSEEADPGGAPGPGAPGGGGHRGAPGAPEGHRPRRFFLFFFLGAEGTFCVRPGVTFGFFLAVFLFVLFFLGGLAGFFFFCWWFFVCFLFGCFVVCFSCFLEQMAIPWPAGHPFPYLSVRFP